MPDFSLYPIFPFEWLIKNIAHQKMTNKSDDYPKVKKFLSEKSILPNFTHSRKIQNKSFFRFFQREMKFLSFYTIIQRCTVIFVEPTITFSLAWNPKTIGFGIDFIKEKLYPNFSREISTRESRYHFRENITTRDPRTERNFWKIENEDNWKFIFR